MFKIAQIAFSGANISSSWGVSSMEANMDRFLRKQNDDRYRY